MEIVGPIRLPHSWAANNVRELTHYLFTFPHGNYLVAEIGKAKGVKDILVRVQSACAFGDIFESRWCDCAWQLKESKRLLFNEESGLLIHAFDQHGKGVGLRNHYRVYAEGQKRNQKLLTETFDFLGLDYENRNYEDVVKILKYFNLSEIRLLTNDPARLHFFEEKGIKIKRIPLVPPMDVYNKEELGIKKEAFGHLIE